MGKSKSRWYKPARHLPDHRQQVEWLDSVGHVYFGMYAWGRWFPHASNLDYIDYVPTFWRPWEG